MCSSRFLLRAVGLQRGRLCDRGKLGILVERIREQLSKTAVRTQDGQCGRGGRGSWEEEAECYKVGEGDAGRDGL